MMRAGRDYATRIMKPANSRRPVTVVKPVRAPVAKERKPAKPGKKA